MTERLEKRRRRLDPGLCKRSFKVRTDPGAVGRIPLGTRDDLIHQRPCPG